MAATSWDQPCLVLWPWAILLPFDCKMDVRWIFLRGRERATVLGRSGRIASGERENSRLIVRYWSRVGAGYNTSHVGSCRSATSILARTSDGCPRSITAALGVSWKGIGTAGLEWGQQRGASMVSATVRCNTTSRRPVSGRTVVSAVGKY